MAISELARAVDMALNVLQRRILTLVALLMTFGLFCWSMALGTWLHLAISGAFGVVIFLPILIKDRPPEARHEESE
jgi:hypothetical protein